MNSSKLKIYTVLFTLILFLSCSYSNEIKFLKTTLDNKSQILSNSADNLVIEKFMNSNEIKEFRKLILEQSNGDKLVIEQKDNDGYLVYLTIRHEHFMIEKQPKKIIELTNIMKNYIVQKDEIMRTIKFY